MMNCTVPSDAPRYAVVAFTITVSSSGAAIAASRNRATRDARPFDSVVSRVETTLPLSNTTVGVSLMLGGALSTAKCTITASTPASSV